MSRILKKLLLAGLLTGALLPVTITCDPGHWDGYVIDGYYDYYYDDYYYEPDGYFFDFWGCC